MDVSAPQPHISRNNSDIFLLFQKTNRGRINFNDFNKFMVNLKTWWGVFKMHTKEKSGILRAERFRDALYDVGFQLSTDILSILILRFVALKGFDLVRY